MRLNIISAIIDHYHEFIKSSDSNYVNTYDFFNDDDDIVVDDPIGGEEGVTIYDELNLDQDYYGEIYHD